MCAAQDKVLLAAVHELGKSKKKKQDSPTKNPKNKPSKSPAKLPAKPSTNLPTKPLTKNPPKAGVAAEIAKLGQAQPQGAIFPTGPSKASKLVAVQLEELGVSYSKEVSFSRCRDKCMLRFDFQVVTEGHVGAIEVDGRQHFVPVDVTKEEFAAAQRRDLIKTAFAHSEGIPLLRLADDLKPEEVVEWLKGFLDHVRKGRKDVIFASNVPEKYAYLAGYKSAARKLGT